MIDLSHKKLEVWKFSIELVKEIYLLTQSFPQNEIYGLTSQIRRAAISIPSNISEGSSKSTDRHFKKYLESSLGSAFEWETQLIIASKLEYINHEKFIELENSIQKLQNMIHNFSTKLKTI